MSEQARQAQLKMIPIAAIEVLNPRERNQRIFDEIVDNIKKIGLKNPSQSPPAPTPMAKCAICWSVVRAE